MSADIELLRLAAKAYMAGIRWDVSKHIPLDANGLPLAWNPLIDDGDALRLAVQLEIELSFINGDTHADGQSEGGPDKQANTRRAIVRAAAAIGRAMP